MKTKPIILDCQPIGTHKAVYVVTINDKPDSIWENMGKAKEAYEALKMITNGNDNIHYFTMYMNL